MANNRKNFVMGLIIMGLGAVIGFFSWYNNRSPADNNQPLLTADFLVDGAWWIDDEVYTSFSIRMGVDPRPTWDFSPGGSVRPLSRMIAMGSSFSWKISDDSRGIIIFQEGFEHELEPDYEGYRITIINENRIRVEAPDMITVYMNRQSE